MNSAYKAAVIGVGRAGRGTDGKGGGHKIGYFHSECYAANPRTCLVAGADVDSRNLAAWQVSFGVDRGYADHRELLADLKPDVVSICTYVGLHAEMIEDCVAAGVGAIFCEKPFLASPREVGRVREAVAASGTKVIVAHYRRYHPVFERIRELVSAGRIGAPLLVWGSMPGWDLSEWGSHWLDLFRFFNQDVPSNWVMGQARVREGRGYGHAMEEQAIAYFELANGCKGLLDGGGDLGQPFHMIVSGSEGEIRFVGDPAGELVFSGPSKLQVRSGDESWVETQPAEDAETVPGLWVRAIDELLDWVEGGAEPRLGFEQMLATSELNLGAYLSAVNRDRIDLPLADLTADEWPLESLARGAAPVLLEDRS